MSRYNLGTNAEIHYIRSIIAHLCDIRTINCAAIIMTEFLSLREAISKYLSPGMSVAMEGFTHLIPHAAGQEIIRQNIRNLSLIRMTPDIIYDQMIGMGSADKITFSWGGNPGVGSLHRFRDAYQKAYPHKITFIEHAHAAMANAYAAGASGLPCAMFKGYRGTTYPEVNKDIKFIECPFTGEKLTIIPSIQPDLAIVHAQKADKMGNIWLKGIIGVQKEAILAAKYSLVTVEEIVDRVSEEQGGVVIPKWVIDAVSLVPMGAFPSYTEGYYNRSNDFYIKWDKISASREDFKKWMEEFVLSTRDFSEFIKKIKEYGYV
jgi:glutaconate CoA-transferase subunit A